MTCHTHAPYSTIFFAARIGGYVVIEKKQRLQLESSEPSIPLRCPAAAPFTNELFSYGERFASTLNGRSQRKERKAAHLLYYIRSSQSAAV
jgi:hypothetical protein